MYDNGTKSPSTTYFAKMRGVLDFGNLSQWTLYESGYGMFANINYPSFVDSVSDTEIPTLFQTFVNVLEQEFKNLDGLQDMQGDTSDISDGISTLNMITKVTEQSGSTISTTYYEKTGRLISKTIELFLRGIKDPKTQYKTYLGALNTKASSKNANFAKEVFNHLFIVTDNTGLLIEDAYLILNAQPLNPDLGNLNHTKGNIEFKEVSIEWNCFPVRGKPINTLAQSYIDAIFNDAETNKNRVIRDSTDFDWTISNNGTDKTLANYNKGAIAVDGTRYKFAPS